MHLQQNLTDNIKSKITLIDGISIFFIVLFHEMGGINRPDSLFLVKYLVTFGLVLFTFSSGFKLSLNHSNEITNRPFLRKHLTKRFIRLYKAYIGYTLLAFVPLYCISYVASNFLKINFEGISSFMNNLNIDGLLKTIIGDNIVSSQLWYLIALIAITAVCFTIIYHLRIRALFFFFLLLILFDVIFWDNLRSLPDILFNIFVYMPAYIFGIFYGHKALDGNKLLASYICSLFFVTFFILSIIYPQSTLFKYSITLYSLTLPPFMILLSKILLDVGYLREPLLRCGKYSFQIYLFHWPIILPLLSRLTINILKFDSFFIPYLITTLAIITCIYAYNLTKKIKLNLLFE
jgi:peptidoglycan/LPS O-acetylase OafA/YrhL